MKLLTSGFTMQEQVAEPMRWSEFIRVRELREGWVRGFSFRIFSS